MAHRMYLYNLDGPDDPPSPVLALMEWNYVFPTLLSPLLSAAPFLARNHCNDTGEADGIYADAEGGKLLMAAFYGFLERHAETLIDDPQAFHAAKRNILALLGNRATGRCFHLDAWDVFNLSDEAHPVQAAALLERIRRDNERIRLAIEQDDPLLLDQCEGLVEEHVSSFRELLNDPEYDYGWEALTSMIYDKAVIFEHAGLMGLMSITGEVLAPARYQSIDDFDAWCDRAVVQRDGRFGHIDTQGRETTPVRYERAFPYQFRFAQVVLGGCVGVVDLDGAEVVTCRYTELVQLTRFADAPYWAAREEKGWGVIDASGNPCLTAEFAGVETWQGTLFATRLGKTIPEVYTDRFILLGEAEYQQVVEFELRDAEGAKAFHYGVWHGRPVGGQTISLFDAHGTALFSAEVDALEYLPAVHRYRVCQQGRYGLIGFGGDPDSRDAGWVVPARYPALEPLRYHSELFCYAAGSGWGIVDGRGVERCPARYESLSAIGRDYVWSGWLAIGFHGGRAFAVREDGEEALLAPDVAHKLLNCYGEDAFGEGQRDALANCVGEGFEAR